jgi:hypothetical protein
LAALIINQTESQDIFTASDGGATRLTLTEAGQLDLPVAGSGGGLVLGDDTQIYDGGTNILRTPDNLTVDLDLIVSGGDITGANSAAIDIGEDTTGTIGFTAGTTGDFLFNLDADTNAQFTAGAAPGVDMVTISNSGQDSTTDNVDALQLTFAASDASGNVIDITPSVSVSASDTFNVIDVDAFTATIDAAGTLTLNGLNFGNLTQSETTGSITATALNIGTGWDTEIYFADAANIDSANDINLRPDADTDDYLYLNTASDLPSLMWETGMSTNDAGFQISATDDTGQLQYRDQNSPTWVSFDDFGLASSDYWQANAGVLSPISR